MIRLYDKSTNRLLAELTEEQFQFLVDELEEEGLEDRDYYINSPTIDMLEEDGADPALVDALRRAIGGKEDLEVRWERS